LGGYVYPPLVMNPGTGSVPAPILSQPIESWVRAPLGQLSGSPPIATVQGGETGFTPEARGTRPSTGQPGVTPGNQSVISSESRTRTTPAPAVGQGRPMLKLKHYDGTESLDTFLHKFQSMATYLQWSEADIKYHLCGSLEGAAGLVLADIAPDA